MTLVVAGIVRDKELFLASDSRLSCGENSWDYATKIFRLYPTDDYVAYCGDSLPALLAISQGLQLLPNTCILRQSGSSGTSQVTARARAFFRHMQEIMRGFPAAWGESCTVWMAGYDHRCKKPRLYSFALGACPREPSEVTLDATTCMGSGSTQAKAILKTIGTPKSGKDIFDAVSTVVADGKEPTVGGNIQMAVIRRGGSKTIGFRFGKKPPHVMGFPVQFVSGMPNVLWFNEQFKRITLRPTMKRGHLSTGKR